MNTNSIPSISLDGIDIETGDCIDTMRLLDQSPEFDEAFRRGGWNEHSDDQYWSGSEISWEVSSQSSDLAIAGPEISRALGTETNHLHPEKVKRLTSDRYKEGHPLDYVPAARVRGRPGTIIFDYRTGDSVTFPKESLILTGYSSVSFRDSTKRRVPYDPELRHRLNLETITVEAGGTCAVMGNGGLKCSNMAREIWERISTSKTNGTVVDRLAGVCEEHAPNWRNYGFRPTAICSRREGPIDQPGNGPHLHVNRATRYRWGNVSEAENGDTTIKLLTSCSECQDERVMAEQMRSC